VHANKDSETLQKRSNSIENIFLIFIIIELLISLLLPQNRLQWFLNLSFYSIILVIILSILNYFVMRLSGRNLILKDAIFRLFSIDNFYLTITALLITINTITTQPNFEIVETTPILTKYYIILYFVYLSFIVISSFFNMDSLFKGITTLMLFSFITFSLPFELHEMGYIPHICLIVFLLFKIIKMVDMKKFGLFRMAFDPVITTLLLIGVISTIFSFYSYESLKALLRYSSYFFTYFIISRTFHRKDITRVVFAILLIFSVFLSLLFISKLMLNAMQYNFVVGLMLKMWLSQIHPNAIVLYTIMLLCFVIGFFISTSRSWFKSLLFIAGLMLTFLIILTYSKTGYVVLPVSILVILGLYKSILGQKFKHIFRFRWYKILIIILLLVFSFTLFPKIYLRIQSRFIKSDYLRERLLYWSLGSRIFKDNLLVGTGYRSYYLLSKYLGTHKYEDARLLRKLFLGETLGSHLHNSYIEMGMTNGIVGIFSFLWLSIILIKIFLMSVKLKIPDNMNSCIFKGGIAASFALLLGAYFDHLLEFLGIGILFFMSLGIISSSSFCLNNNLTNNDENNSSGSTLKKLTYAVILIYFLIITSLCSAHVIFDYGKRALFDSYAKGETYFRLLDFVDTTNWKYRKFLFERRLSDAMKFRTNLKMSDCFNDLKKSVETNPNFTPGYRNLGYLYWIFGDLKQAKRCFEISLNLDPAGGFWDQHFADLGLIEYRLSEYENSFNHIKEAIKLNPLTVNSDFWVLKSESDIPSMKFISSRFSNKLVDKYELYILQRYFIQKIMTYKKGSIQSVQLIETVNVDKDLTGMNEVNLENILSSIYNDYLHLKSKNPEESRALLISLVSAYYHLGDKAMVTRLMDEEELNYLPAINTKGMMIPRIDPFASFEKKLKKAPGILNPVLNP